MSEKNAAVLFDLDGTLVDTAPDLANALNVTLKHFGRDPLPFERIRPEVSHGGIALIRLGFEIEPDDKAFEDYRQFLLDYYQDNLSVDSRLFEGMDVLLEKLESNGIPWGVVTNKPSWLTDPLMQQMGMDKRAACIVSGDTCDNKKPHPEPIHHACQLAGVSAEHCWYIGDAERDIEAGNAAGCTTVTALFGYIDDDDQPENWHADHIISHPSEMMDLLTNPQN
ncbi:MAG: phosphoglycolate phosphatase [Gammaproteobacteria bacterium]|nr:phosphoglycolate phosphatase [Gammaproteobacteria bacterium]